MADEKRQTYCRMCGANKGHSFGQCKNSSAMRKIIIDQDAALQNALDRSHRAEKDAAALSQWMEHSEFLDRVAMALLELNDIRRKQVSNG